MAHNYVVTGINHLGDVAQVNGTVDGIPVIVSTSFSTITQLPNITAFQNFIAPLMLVAAFPNVNVVTDTTHNTSFSQ